MAAIGEATGREVAWGGHGKGGRAPSKGHKGGAARSPEPVDGVA
jgi:hypothetical protein